tara:strand:+ start:21644 stop:23101 length:1458 start_codon:yes stop_codon:yes gene_type:complete
VGQPAIIVIDQGTSSTKGFLFDENLNVHQIEKIPHKVKRPKPGWVECDAKEIVNSCEKILFKLNDFAHSEFLSVVAIGMAFQRSTFLFWDKLTNEPIASAMSWQDSRADKLAKDMSGKEKMIQNLTGIPLSGHFGGPKYLHAITNNRQIEKGVHSEKLIFGSISSYVVYCLTGKHIIDHSICGRSLLMNLSTLSWEKSLLELFQVSPQSLPRITPTCSKFGDISIFGNSIPLLCIIGDQQASLVGQGRWRKGDVALNFGTSGSVLVNSGKSVVIVPSLLSNVLFSSEKEVHFLLEGTINSVGSLFKWLEEKLGINHENMLWHERCASETNGVLVPGLSGISSPYWTGEFNTKIFGLESNASSNDFVRAGMESIGFLVYDICNTINNKTKINLRDIIASGGSSRGPLIQFIADILDNDIATSSGKDMTALGVARLVTNKAFGRPLVEKVKIEENFMPKMKDWKREKKLLAWHNALNKLSIINNNKS